jgi:Zn-dependent peptidase ImmA (M78 family)/transcriptional regulator with XRE-family HTH domain
MAIKHDSAREDINSEMLGWARAQAGLSLGEAARAIGLKDSTKKSAVEKLSALEQGEKLPTRSQLSKIAQAYHRPLVTFYLSKPPIVAELGADFRRLSEPVAPRDKGLLDALLRDLRTRQSMIRSILEDDEDREPLLFVNSLPLTTPIEQAAQKLHRFLEMDRVTPKDVNSPSEHFNALRQSIERQGVFVLLIGNLGSHHSNISEKIFRGAVIADDMAPFIVINDQDAQTARSFTLIHELVHLFVGSTGISAAPNSEMPRTKHDKIERFCNDVASEVLLPSRSLASYAPIETLDEANEIIPAIAAEYHVSEYLVAYRFWRDGKIRQGVFTALSGSYAARWEADKARKREESREKDGGGPSYYVVRRHRLGQALLQFVGQNIRSGELTHTKAAKLLSINTGSVERLLSQAAVAGSWQRP